MDPSGYEHATLSSDYDGPVVVADIEGFEEGGRRRRPQRRRSKSGDEEEPMVDRKPHHLPPCWFLFRSYSTPPRNRSGARWEGDYGWLAVAGREIGRIYRSWDLGLRSDQRKGIFGKWAQKAWVLDQRVQYTSRCSAAAGPLPSKKPVLYPFFFPPKFDNNKTKQKTTLCSFLIFFLKHL